MNREIKFRAWDRQNKEMFYSDFHLSAYGKVLWWISEEGYAENRTDEVDLMQYTGLKDKNNKEIYEGDILIDDDSEPCRHRIIWMDDKARFEIETLMDESGSWDYGEFPLEDQISYRTGKENMLESFEVIGNIYEKPELLK